MVLQQWLLEKANFIFKMTSLDVIPPASPDFWKTPIIVLFKWFIFHPGGVLDNSMQVSTIYVQKEHFNKALNDLVNCLVHRKFLHSTKAKAPNWCYGWYGLQLAAGSQ